MAAIAPVARNSYLPSHPRQRLERRGAGSSATPGALACGRDVRGRGGEDTIPAPFLCAAFCGQARARQPFTSGAGGRRPQTAVLTVGLPRESDAIEGPFHSYHSPLTTPEVQHDTWCGSPPARRDNTLIKKFVEPGRSNWCALSHSQDVFCFFEHSRFTGTHPAKQPLPSLPRESAVPSYRPHYSDALPPVLSSPRPRRTAPCRPPPPSKFSGYLRHSEAPTPNPRRILQPPSHHLSIPTPASAHPCTTFVHAAASHPSASQKQPSQRPAGLERKATGAEQFQIATALN